MKPTEALKHEHQIVLLVLDGTEREGKSAKKYGEFNVQNVEKMVDFFRTFVDRCHHAKEERFLFPALCKRGLPIRGAPIEVLLEEHEAGRNRVKVMAKALPGAEVGRPKSRVALAENLLAYVKLLRKHITREDDCLFPVADTVLTAKDQSDLVKAFGKLEAEEIGEGVHEKYHQFAHELAEGVHERKGTPCGTQRSKRR